MADSKNQNSRRHIELLEGKPMVVATSKQETREQFVRILGGILLPVLAYNPENLAVDAEDGYPEHYQDEPANDDPVKAVEFKLRRRLHELIQSKLQELSDYLVVASDVVFRANGQSHHRLSRNADEAGQLDVTAGKVILLERYQQPFLAEWEVAFGLAEKDQVSSGIVRVSGDYPPLSAEQIERYFDPNANPGLRLIELGIELGVSFHLSLSKDTDAIICNTPKLRQLVEQFIVKKVPTIEMIEALYQAGIEQQPEQFGIFALALSNF